MAQNYIQPGDQLDYINVTEDDIVSGEPVFSGKIIGVALGDIAEDATGVIRTKGVFQFTKDTPLAITAGDPVFWNTTNSEVTKTATDKFIGYAVDDAASADTTVNVLLASGLGGALIAALTDNSGGVAADGTIAAVTDSATAANAIKELATKVNEIISTLKSAGLIAGA